MIPFQLVPSVCDSIGMALSALEKFPTLVTALDIENESPVLALASMYFEYTSGNQLMTWNHQIYHCESDSLCGNQLMTWNHRIYHCESHSLFSTTIKLWTKFEYKL